MGSLASISMWSINRSIDPPNQSQPQQQLQQQLQPQKIDLQSMQSIASVKGLNKFFVFDTTHKHNKYHKQAEAAIQRW